MPCAGTALLHATGASCCWLMGKCYSCISTFILYRMVQGSWLLVSPYNNSERGAAEIWERIRAGAIEGCHAGLMDGCVDAGVDGHFGPSIDWSTSTLLSLHEDSSWTLEENKLFRCVSSLLRNNFLPFAVFPSLSFPTFRFLHVALNSTSPSTKATSDNEVIYHCHVEKVHVFAPPWNGKDMFSSKITFFFSADSVNPPEQSLEEEPDASPSSTSEWSH